MEEPIIRLRPHHALCSMHYQGEGYDEEFARNMARIRQRLGSGQRQMIKIIMHRDSLCEHCPHDRDYACRTEQQVLELDRAIAEACGLRSGQWLPWDELNSRIRDRLMPEGTLPGLCEACRNYPVCAGQRR